MSIAATDIPEILYHWTEAENVDSIKESGITAFPGGLFGFHPDQPGVCRTTWGDDPKVGWNTDIPWIANPVRIAIDVSQLNGELLGADENSLLNEDSPVWLFCDNPEEQILTARASLHYTGNCRYAANVPASAIIDTVAYQAPSDWNMDQDDAWDLAWVD